MDVSRIVEDAGLGVDRLGVAIIVVGVVLDCLRGISATFVRRPELDASVLARRSIGRRTLFGLEALVAGDIIRTEATRPTFTGVGVLAIIIVIRRALSWTLELEVAHRWPWQAGQEGPGAR